MPQDHQLGLVRAPPDILDHPQMDGLASTISSRSSDSTRAGTTMSSRLKSGAAMATSMNQDQLPSPPQQALKCPRCDSMNTKFCYYNNYSQTQPRHFCKSCRRYWTQGGALRNVPVGGGCRKNKRVKPRSFLNMGVVPGLLDPNSLLMDDSTSNMLAKLSNISSFGGGAAAGGGSANFGDEQLLNIAFSRFQESMRLRQQQCNESGGAEGGAVPFFDMGFPSLVQRPCTPGNCTCGLCGSRSSAPHPSLNIGCTGFDNHMGFGTLRGKSMERGDGVFAPFEVNPSLYDQTSNGHHHSNIPGTSATATLASIEDQLSTFSNLQPQQLVEQPFEGEDEKSANSGRLVSSPLQLLGGHGGTASHHGDHVLHTAHFDQQLSSEERAREVSKLSSMQDEKPFVNVDIDHHHWQQSTFMSEMLFEPPNSHSHWTTSHASARWPDMHTLSSTAAAAGGIV